MSGRVVKSARVEKDIAEIADYIGQQNVDAGLRFFDAVEETFQNLAHLPGMGIPYETDHFKLAKMRISSVSGFEKYWIVFRPLEDGISVFYVLHGARDWGFLLQERLEGK